MIKFKVKFILSRYLGEIIIEALNENYCLIQFKEIMPNGSVYKVIELNDYGAEL